MEEGQAMLIAHLRTLTGSLDQVGRTLAAASGDMQVKMGRTSEKLEDAINGSTEKLVNSLDRASTAAREAAAASDTFRFHLVSKPCLRLGQSA